MLNVATLFDNLAALGLDAWRNRLEIRVREHLADGSHGQLPRWREVLGGLPPATAHPATFDDAVVSVGPPHFSREMHRDIRSLLLELLPWRKGPFRIGDIMIDAEWRSDRKWARLENVISPLDGRFVLDVGCGNGYYAWRMRGAGARAVIGIDPTLSHLAQFLAVRHWTPAEPVHVLPLRLHELPTTTPVFDTVFSMGVLYHQRDPLQHLAQLRTAISRGGELILETLVLPGETRHARTPEERYARMRNVWLLPTMPQLLHWLDASSFDNCRVIDVSATTTEEQRSTEWMPFESLSAALDPRNPALTVEGWPAPRRALVVCARR